MALPPSSARAGFTLLEICLAVAIIVMLVMVAAPSITGLLAEQRLHRSFDDFDLLVRKAQARSVDERRTYALVWTKEAVELQPLDPREGDAAAPERLAMSKTENFALERPAALAKNAPPIWTFWQSGVCEPAIVSYKGPDGTWAVKYDALTAHGTFLKEEVR